MSAVKEFFSNFLISLGLLKPPVVLSNFQRAKLLHEFRTFYDVNKDGRLQWKDFELARDQICTKSGWKPHTQKYEHCRDLFVNLWRNLQDSADSDVDCEITEAEWLSLWIRVLKAKREHEKTCSSSKKTKSKNISQSKNDVQSEVEDFPYIPIWFQDYIDYKFNLLDRAGDGFVDEEEFEYTLNDMFNIPPQDCRVAFCMISQNKEKKVDKAYFRLLALEYYLSDDPSDLGNFMNGKLQYDLQ